MPRQHRLQEKPCKIEHYRTVVVWSRALPSTTHSNTAPRLPCIREIPRSHVGPILPGFCGCSATRIRPSSGG